MAVRISASRSSRSIRQLATRLLCSTAVLLLPDIAAANPTGGQVVAGSATVSQPSAGLTTVTQHTEKAIINWQSFGIGTGETTGFNQPDANAITLNRVVGVDPSKIMGNLTANGHVWLINPNGIAFGASARVDVSGLLATTIDIADKDFMSGAYRFTALKNPSAMVTNAGLITVRDAGLAALVAPGVANSGVIEANLGRIQLSAAAAFTVDLYGDGLFNITLDKQVTQAIKRQDGASPAAAVSNSGWLVANGGKILLTANAAKSVVDHAIDMTGYAEATSASVAQNGDIVLDGGSEGTVAVAGMLDASGTGAGQTGGTVEVTGADVRLAPTANIDASGDAGGGTVHIGGDEHGAGPLRSAVTTSIASGATIAADAISKGNGGTVVVWSDDQTIFQGTVSARGGAAGGDGGSAEVSSHGVLNFNGTVDLRAPAGLIGSLLLDPENVTIAANGDTPTLPSSPNAPIVLNPTADDSILSVTTLQNALALADVTVSTGSTGSQAGDITVATNVSWNGGNSLTLSAFHDISVSDGVTIANTGSGNLTLHADNTGTGNGTVTFNGAGTIDYSKSTGLVSIFYNPADNPAGSVVNATSYTIPTDFSPHVLTNASVPGQLTAYMLVNSAFDLQNVENNLSGDFALGRDIDASATASWNGGAGFAPIGGSGLFSGILDGENHVVSGLTINSPNQYVGLIGRLSGTLENITVSGATVSATKSVGITDVGGLVGLNLSGGTIKNAAFSGAVTANLGRANAGGVVGENDGTVESSHASGSLSGANICACGGLAGQNNGTVTQSSAGNSVNGDNGVDLGGLVSTNTGAITQSFATGAVTAGTNGNNRAGGLVAVDTSTGSISDSYATGSVGGGAYIVGGLVGEVEGSIANSYAIGAVSTSLSGPSGGLPSPQTGGLAAYTVGAPTITNSYWDTGTTGQAASIGGTGLTDAALKSGLPSGFSSAVWAIDPSVNNGYPYLKWQIASPSPSPIAVNFGVAALIPLTWSVANASSTYGTLATLGVATLNGVTASDNGLVDGTVGLFLDQNLSMPVTLSAGLNAGTYYEAVSGLTGTAAGKYTLSSTGNILGVLTIDPKMLTWTVPDAAFAFGSAPSIGTATLSGIVGTDDVRGVVEVFGNTGVMSISSTTPDGFYTEKVVGLAGTAAKNYSLATIGNTTGTLTIYSPLALTSFTLQSIKPIQPKGFNFITSVSTSKNYISPVFVSTNQTAVDQLLVILQEKVPELRQYLSDAAVGTAIREAIGLALHSYNLTPKDIEDFFTGYFESSGYRNLINESIGEHLSEGVALHIVADLTGNLAAWIAKQEGLSDSVIDFEKNLTQLVATGFMSGPQAEAISAGVQIAYSGRELTIQDVTNFNMEINQAQSIADSANARAQKMLREGNRTEALAIQKIAADALADIAKIRREHPFVAFLSEVPEATASIFAGNWSGVGDAVANIFSGKW